GDVLLVRLERAATDLEQLRVAEEALHLVLAAISPAAEHLHRVVGDLLPDRRGEELRGVGAQAIPRARADPARDRVDQRPRRFGLGVALTDVALDLTMFGDALPERSPIDRVARHDLDAAVRDAEAHRSQGDALDLQVAHHVLNPASDTPEHVLRGD